MNSRNDFNPEPDMENFARQSDLIHLVVAYHRARVKEGRPFCLSRDVWKDVDFSFQDIHLKNPLLVLDEQLLLQGEVPLQIHRPQTRYRPTHDIARGITASVWHSCNHVFRGMRSRSLQKHSKFLFDPALAEFVSSMKSTDAGTYSRGADTVPSGFSVGIDTMTKFAAMRAGLSGGHRFDPVALSQALSKSDGTKLSLLKMNLFLATALGTEDSSLHHAREWLPGNPVMGMPKEKVRQFTDATAPGCPAREKMSDGVRELLDRHNLLTEEQEKNSAIVVLCHDIQNFVRREFEQLRLDLQPGEHAALSAFDRAVVRQGF